MRPSSSCAAPPSTDLTTTTTSLYYYRSGSGRIRTLFLAGSENLKLEMVLTPPALRIRDVLSRIRTFSHSESRIRIQNLFYPGSRILQKKWNANLHFSCLYTFRSKVLVLVIVKKIRDPEKIQPGSGSRIRIKDAGGKKHRIRNTGPLKGCFNLAQTILFCSFFYS
jgi:hypothetical protein